MIPRIYRSPKWMSLGKSRWLRILFEKGPCCLVSTRVSGLEVIGSRNLFTGFTGPYLIKIKGCNPFTKYWQDILCTMVKAKRRKKKTNPTKPELLEIQLGEQWKNSLFGVILLVFCLKRWDSSPSNHHLGNNFIYFLFVPNTQGKAHTTCSLFWGMMKSKIWDSLWNY